MPNSRRFARFAAFALTASLVACSSEPSPVTQAPIEPAAAARVAPEAQTLSVGFATVDMTWRIGAKPGQVGTDANTFQIALLWKDLIDLLIPAFRMQRKDQILELDEYASGWTIDHINSQNEKIRYDRYVDAFLPGRGMHTRSYAKAMVLESQGEKVAVVKADLYLMQKTLWRKVSELVAAETGLKPENILISATHNHSAADAAFTQIGISTLAENFDPRHFVWISQKIAQAIIEADRTRVPAKMGAVKTKLREVQRNVIGPATAQVVPPGGTEPVSVQAGYPRDFFDDDLWVLHFDDASTGRRLGAYFVFGMHPESLEEGHGLLSSDFAGLTEIALEERWGVPVIWAPGALGDVEQDSGDNFGTDYWREDFLTLESQVRVLTDAIGPILETAPLSTDQVIAPRGDIAIATRTRVFPGAPNTNYPGPTPWMVPVTEYLSPDFPITCTRALTESANILLQTIRLGDVLLMGSPSEITTDMAKHIRSRIDDVPGNLYQGYIWPGSPQWVIDEVGENFDNRELSSAEGFAMPIVLSQVNDYMGYMVTRWEFNNRHHYRQSMTLYGEDTANYIAGRFEGLARELRGQPAESVVWDDPSIATIPLEDQVYAAVQQLEPVVKEFMRNVPPENPVDMGRITTPPTRVESDEMGSPSIHFAWKGPSSDMEIPKVAIDLEGDNGVWTELLDETHPHLWVLYTAKGQWEIVWHLVDVPMVGNYRIRVQGEYRGTKAGASTPDPIWDPEGKDVPYTVVSPSFAMQ